MIEDRAINYIELIGGIKYNVHTIDLFNEVYVLPPFDASHMGKVIMALDYSKKNMGVRERGEYYISIQDKIEEKISRDKFMLYDLEAVEEAAIKSKTNSGHAKESLDLKIKLADVSLESTLQEQWKAMAELRKRRAEELLSDQENRREKRLKQAYNDVIAENWGEQKSKEIEEEVDKRVATPDTGVKKNTSLKVGGSSKDRSSPV